MISSSASRRHAALAIVAIASLLSLASSGASVGNEASVVQDGRGAAAVCQLAILVRAVVVLDLEDSLGLVARDGGSSAASALATRTSEGTTWATCDVVVERLRVVVPRGESIRAGSYVSGPPTVDATRASPDAVAEDAALCQYFLLLDSVIITGGAYGLPSGTADAPLLVGPEAGHASCRVEVGEVEIIET